MISIRVKNIGCSHFPDSPFLLPAWILVKKTGDNYTCRDCLKAPHQNDPALEIDEFSSA